MKLVISDSLVTWIYAHYLEQRGLCAVQSVSAHISSKPTAMRPLTAIYGHHKELFSVGKMSTFVTQMV